jgi:tRNA A-37 threonylcarbamoyl transferase component Bud32
MVQLLSVFRTQVSEELDLRNEARFMHHYRALLDQVNLPRVTVPTPHDDIVGRRVLTMDFLDGVPVDDLAGVARYGLDPRQMILEGLRSWFLTAIRNGFFHGDVHAGNFMLLRDGRLGIIDWGIVGRLDPETHAFFRRIIEAALGREGAWDDVVDYLMRHYGAPLKDAMGLSDDELRTFFRNQIEPVVTLPFGQVSLAGVLAGPGRDEVGAAARPKRSLLDVVRTLRETRRYHRRASEVGPESEFDLAGFLLQKQLLYFERYGKMFLADLPLLADHEFFEAALAAPPIGTATPAA